MASRIRRGVAALVILVHQTAVSSTLELNVEGLFGDSWWARNLSLHAGLDGTRFRLRAESLTLPEPVGETRNLELLCQVFSWGDGIVRCGNATVEADNDFFRPTARGVEFVFEPATERATLKIAELQLAGGKLALSAQLQKQDWYADLSFQGVSAAGLRDLFVDTAIIAASPFRLQGDLAGRIEIQGRQDEALFAKVELESGAVNFADDEGALAGEDLAFALNSEIVGPKHSARIRGELRLAGGALYIEPLLVDVEPNRPVTLKWRGRLTPERLELEDFVYLHPGVGTLSGTAGGSLKGGWPSNATVELSQGDLTKLYDTYLQPFLYTTVLSDLSAEGQVDAALVMADGDLEQLRLRADGVGLTDEEQRFSLQRLSGDISWQQTTQQFSSLRWDSAEIYRIPVGAATLNLSTLGDSFNLESKLRVPLLGGVLEIDELAARNMASPEGEWSIRGRLDDLSMDELSRTLGWVGISGKLSGEIPKAVYSRGQLNLGGVIAVQALGGEIAVSGLEVEELLGRVPRLRAGIELIGLDLEDITSTFSFGKIEGALSGHIRDLELVTWVPVRFDAVLTTPQGSTKKQRISQRAIESISSLGGGGGAALLSKGVLSVFKKFPYRRLGIKCRLESGICQMGGVAGASDGYYLVEGSGLPRIDVIGYERRVDWDVLVGRIKAATESSAPLVE